MKKFLLKTEWRSLAARLQARPRTTSATHRDQHPGMVLPQMSDAGPGQVEKRRSALASGGAAAVRGSGASPGSAVHGSNRRAQAIHGLLAPDPRTTASFATSMSVASSIPAPACRKECRAEAMNTTLRRPSLQGDFVRAGRVHVEPGCTAPACWSRTRNHAADEIPLQRRPPPEAKLLPLQRRPPPEDLYSSRTAAHPRLSLWLCKGGPMPPLNWVKNQKTRPGDCRALWSCSLASDQFWTFSSVRRFSSLLQPGMVCGVETSGRLSP